MSAKKRVVVAMSGGVDSSVAAALLVEQGYDVVGMMLRLWSEPGQAAFNRCCTPDQMADARRIAGRLGIPFYAIDIRAPFRETIVQYFIDGYARGETPNPCIECNRSIRFDMLLQRALALGADYLATGHYAQIVPGADGLELHKGLDEAKDQSYVLHVLGAEKLSRVMFPIGGYRKAEVRALAERFELGVGGKGESMDLCFLGQGDYRGFLRRNAPEVGRPGDIVTQSGEYLGRHDGLPFYTIGQRKGLGVGDAGRALYVVRKDVAANQLVVGDRAALGIMRLAIRDVTWLTPRVPTETVSASIKIRYRARELPGRVTAGPNRTAVVEFDAPVSGAAPGQGAVFYQSTRVLGGGLIDAAGTAAGN